MLSPEAVHEIMTEVDHNRDGKIDYAEFCAMILPRWVPRPATIETPSGRTVPYRAGAIKCCNDIRFPATLVL